MKLSIYLFIWQSFQEAVSYRDKVFNEIYIYIYTQVYHYIHIQIAIYGYSLIGKLCLITFSCSIGEVDIFVQLSDSSFKQTGGYLRILLETLDLNLTKALTDIVNSIFLKTQPQMSSTFSSLAPWSHLSYKRRLITFLGRRRGTRALAQFCWLLGRRG